MERIARARFIEKLAQIGILLDPAYPKVVIPVFKSSDSHSRFWSIPEHASQFPYFIKTILNLIDKWDAICIWKANGSWTTKVTGERINNDIQSIIYRGVGISNDSSDIIQFSRNEITEVVAIAFNQLLFGWSVADDIFLIPNHGNQTVKTDHHGVVHVGFKDESSLNSFIDEMAKKDILLPNEIPDETFKKPDWMP
jgi:hypothetical protein